MVRESIQRWIASLVTGTVTLRLRRGDDYTILDTQGPGFSYHPDRLSMERVENAAFGPDGPDRPAHHAQPRHRRLPRQAGGLRRAAAGAGHGARRARHAVRRAALGRVRPDRGGRGPAPTTTGRRSTTPPWKRAPTDAGLRGTTRYRPAVGWPVRRPGRRTRWPRCRSPRSSTGALAPYDVRGSMAHARVLHRRRAAHRRRAGRHARRAGQARAPTSTSGAFGPAPDDEDVHSALERGLIERAGPELGGKLRAGPLAQRPGRHPVPDVAARRRPPRRRRACWTSSRRWSRRPTRTRTRRCPGAPTCSTPSRCCSPTTWPRTRTPCCATSTGCATGTGAPRCRPYGSGALAGLVARAGPGGGRRRAGLRPQSSANSIDGTAARDFAAEAAFVLAMIGGGPVPAGRGGDPLGDGRVRLRHARRRVLHRQLDHAAEEEPGRRGAGPRQGRAADRQPDRAAGHAQGPAARLQPRPAGGQGAAVRLGRAAGAAAPGGRRDGRDAHVPHRPAGRAGAGRVHASPPTSPSGWSARACRSGWRTRRPAGACARPRPAASGSTTLTDAELAAVHPALQPGGARRCSPSQAR